MTLSSLDRSTNLKPVAGFRLNFFAVTESTDEKMHFLHVLQYQMYIYENYRSCMWPVVGLSAQLKQDKGVGQTYHACKILHRSVIYTVLSVSIVYLS